MMCHRSCPAAAGSLPESFGYRNSLRNLSVLNLGSNNLTGGLPSGYGGPNSLPNLQVRNLALKAHSAEWRANVG